MGNDRTAEAMTTCLVPRTSIVDYMYLEADFTVPEDGNYYFGTHSVSEGDNWEIALFDIYVGENIDPEVNDKAPGAAELVVTPIYGVKEFTGFDGKKQYFGAADIEVTLPTQKANGEALADSELLDVTVIATDSLKNQFTIDYVPSSVREIVASDKPFDVYATDGKQVRSNTRSTNGLKGIYVIGNRKAVLK